jgi:hypothetical protein
MFDLIVLLDAVAVSILPFYIGLLLLLKEGWLQRNHSILYPLSLGAIIFFMIDSFRDSADLGGDARVYQGGLILLPFLAFILILVFWKRSTEKSAGLAYPLAFALSLHTAGESSEIVVLFQAISINQLFANYIPGFIGFFGHKLIEGFILAFLFSGIEGRKTNKYLKAALLILIVSFFGAFTAINSLLTSVYLFSAGTAGELFLIAYFVESKDNTSAKFYIYLLIGFLAIYLLGYLHSIA